MAQFENGSDQQIIYLQAEVGALKLLVKELVHLVDEERLKVFKKAVSHDKVHDLLCSDEEDRVAINNKANRIARSLVEKVIIEKNLP